MDFQLTTRKVCHWLAEMLLLCQICSKEPSKYRCPRCDLRGTKPCHRSSYDIRWLNSLTACSLQCSKEHKLHCVAQIQAPADATVSIDTGAFQTSGITNLSSTNHESSSLDSITSASEIRELFAKYPKLRQVLRGIYESSKEQLQQNMYSDSHGPKPNQASKQVGDRLWTQEKGVDYALKRLQWHLQTAEASSTGIIEFRDYIRRLRGSHIQHHDNGQHQHT